MSVLLPGAFHVCLNWLQRPEGRVFLAIGPMKMAMIKGSANYKGAYFSVSSKDLQVLDRKKVWKRAATLTSL